MSLLLTRVENLNELGIAYSPENWEEMEQLAMLKADGKVVRQDGGYWLPPVVDSTPSEGR